MAIDYPAGLPIPQTSVITPLERRAMSDPEVPREARAQSRDRLQFERATWIFTAAQVEVFRAWWETDLRNGGAWFNATFPVPEGLVEKQHCFRTQPRYGFVPGGFWKVSAVLEVRGRGRPVDFGVPSVAAGVIAWFDPINDPVTGTLAHSNSGTGLCDSFAEGPVVALNAGMVGWSGQVLVWSVIWDPQDPGNDDAAPFIDGSVDGTVSIAWISEDGTTFPVSPASIGTLIVTATIDGNPVAVGQRLIAVTTPPTIDYPSIAWGPE